MVHAVKTSAARLSVHRVPGTNVVVYTVQMLMVRLLVHRVPGTHACIPDVSGERCAYETCELRRLNSAVSGRLRRPLRAGAAVEQEGAAAPQAQSRSRSAGEGGGWRRAHKEEINTFV